MPQAPLFRKFDWALADACCLMWVACMNAVAFALSYGNIVAGDPRQFYTALFYAAATLIVGWAALESFALAGEE